MRIVGLEGVHHFQQDGSVGNSCCMLIEITGGDTFRIPIDSATYTMLTQLGEYGVNVKGTTKKVGVESGVELSKALREEPKLEHVDQGPSLQEFANGFITGPNLGQELVDTRVDAPDPVSELQKIGMFGEPQDILKSLSMAQQNSGPDVVESFEDTSDQYEESDPGEENGSIAEQY